MKENIGTVQYASLLYDFYGELLNENQHEVMTMYHEDNLSLSEIAEELGMTRQAVHYTLKKAENKLEEYDEKLGLVKTYKVNQDKVAKAIELTKQLGSKAGKAAEAEPLVKQIIALIQEISE